MNFFTMLVKLGIPLPNFPSCVWPMSLTMVWWLPRFELSKSGLMSFGLMVVANLWGFQNGETYELRFDGCHVMRFSKLGDLWALVWLLPTYGAFKMGTYELWFDGCQLMRLSKWEDLWALVWWWLPTYEAFKMGTYELWFDGCQLMSFKNGDSWASTTTTTCSISKATTIPQKNQGAWDQPNNANRTSSIRPKKR